MAPAVDELTVPTTDSWSDNDQKISVRSAPGYLFDLLLRSKLEASPEEVYNVLTDPEAANVFRGIKDVIYRKTIEDDGRGSRKLQVGHRACTRFLWLSVTFETELFVWEDDHKKTIRFRNAKEDGFMKRFEGTWNVQPFTQATLDQLYKPQAASQEEQTGSTWFSPAAALSTIGSRLSRTPSESSSHSLVSLEQAIVPRAQCPGPLMRVVRGLCARTLQNMMEDVRRELEVRKATQQQQGQQLLPSGKAEVPARAACISGAGMDMDIWRHVTPLSITIRL